MIEFILFVLWVATCIWFTRRLDTIAKNSERTAEAVEQLVAMQRSIYGKTKPSRDVSEA